MKYKATDLLTIPQCHNMTMNQINPEQRVNQENHPDVYSI